MNVAGHDHIPLRVMRTPLDRGEFFALVGRAIGFALPGSAPVLMLIELGGLNVIAQANGPAMALADAAACRIANVVGEGGYVSVQRSGRIATLVENDGSGTIDALSTAMLGCLVRPLVVDGVTLLAGGTLGVAQWHRDGETAEELFVAADQAIRTELAKAAVTAPKSTSVNYRPSPLRAA